MTSGFFPIPGDYLDFSSSFYIWPCLFSFGFLFFFGILFSSYFVFGFSIYPTHGEVIFHMEEFFIFSTPFFTFPFYFVYIGPVLRPNDGDSADPMLV